MARIDKIKEALKNRMGAEDKIGFHNERSQENVRGEDDIYPNDEDFFQMFYANDPFGAVQRAVYGNYNPQHDYVMLDGYGNFKSMDEYELEKNLYSDNELAEFLDEHPDLIEAYGLELEDEEPNEVSEEQYYDALEVLPPYYFDSINGKKVSGGFAVGEPTSHTSSPEGYRATYSGYYKSGGKYFEVGQVYFVFADEQGEPNDQGSANVEVKTLDPDAFAKGGGVRRPLFSNREYSYGRNWTNDHRHQNKKEDYEVPMKNRKRKYSGGGGISGLSNQELEERLGYVQEDVKRVLNNAPNEFLDLPVDGWENIGTILSNIEIASDLTDDESKGWNNSDEYYAKGGGVRNHNGREYAFGRAWTNDHRHENRREDWEVPQADRVRKFATGGGIELTDKQKKIDMNQNGRIDAEDFAILRKSMNGAWRNEHKHVNHSEGHEKSYARRKNPSRTGYKGRKEYGNGGSTDSYDYEDIGQFSVPDADWKKYSDKDFEEMGRKIVKEKYAGDLGKAYNEIVRKKFSGGGSTDKPKEPVAFNSSNLYYNGKGIDINGNAVVRVSFPNSRAFSIQTNGTLPETHSGSYDEAEINEYVRDYGSPAQKKKLKIYKK